MCIDNSICYHPGSVKKYMIQTRLNVLTIFIVTIKGQAVRSGWSYGVTQLRSYAAHESDYYNSE